MPNIEAYSRIPVHGPTPPDRMWVGEFVEPLVDEVAAAVAAIRPLPLYAVPMGGVPFCAIWLVDFETKPALVIRIG